MLSQNVNLGSMPQRTANDKRRTTKAKFLKILFVLRSLGVGGLIALFLSGCQAIGTSKPAALQVTSVPEASIFLDGKHIGKTPFFSDQLKSGEYLLKISASEASYVDKVILTGGTLTVVNRELSNNFLAQSGETLWLDSGKKGLFVSSLPGKADMTIDGRLVGKTPFLLDEIEDGEHKIILTKAGFIDREFSIKTSSKYQVMANVTLASEVAKNPQPSPVPLPQVEKVKVLATSVGFLRVRREPSLTAAEIGRVKTGDELEVIQETKDWIKVKFEGKQGWISAQYTKKL